jgi:hypothetical protein
MLMYVLGYKGVMLYYCILNNTKKDATTGNPNTTKHKVIISTIFVILCLVREYTP